MKHDKYELTYKKFLKARDRLDEIRQEKRNTPLVELQTPYQKGWRLKIALREDFLRSDKGPIVKALIDKYGVEKIIRNAKHISQIRKKPTLSDVRALLAVKGYSYYNNGGPYIKSLRKGEYNALNEQVKKYFTFFPGIKTSRWQKEYAYELGIPHFYLMVKVEKNMITHTRDINPSLLKEEAELEKILEPYWRTFHHGEKYYHYFERRKERRASKVELTKIDTNEPNEEL